MAVKHWSLIANVMLSLMMMMMMLAVKTLGS